MLDLSSEALAAARTQIGPQADRIYWIEADITLWKPSRAYDVWHDRATFHFLVGAADRAAYLARLTRYLAPGGHAVVATFATDGPDRCSGLPVLRYDGDTLSRTLGPDFSL